MYFNGLMFWYSAVFYWLYSHASVLIYSLFLYRLNIIVICFLNLSFFRTIFHVFNSFVLFCIFLSFITHFSIPLYWYLSREAFWQETVLSPLTHDLCQPPPGTQLPSDTSSSYHFGLLLLKYEIDIGNQLNYIGTQLPSDTSSSYRTTLYFHFFAPRQIFHDISAILNLNSFNPVFVWSPPKKQKFSLLQTETNVQTCVSPPTQDPQLRLISGFKKIRPAARQLLEQQTL